MKAELPGRFGVEPLLGPFGEAIAERLVHHGQVHLGGRALEIRGLDRARRACRREELAQEPRLWSQRAAHALRMKRLENG